MDVFCYRHYPCCVLWGVHAHGAREGYFPGMLAYCGWKNGLIQFRQCLLDEAFFRRQGQCGRGRDGRKRP